MELSRIASIGPAAHHEDWPAGPAGGLNALDDTLWAAVIRLSHQMLALKEQLTMFSSFYLGETGTQVEAKGLQDTKVT